MSKNFSIYFIPEILDYVYPAPAILK